MYPEKNSSNSQTASLAGMLFNHRRFAPWYDDRADYNTDAKSYYDYLARTNKLLDAIADLINRLLRREIKFNDTTTIDFTDNGNWETVDEILVSASVIISKLKHGEYANSIYDDGNGIFSKDFTDEINGIHNDIKKLGDRVTTLEKIVNQILDSIASAGYIEVPRDINIDNNHKLINPVDLGVSDDSVRIEITSNLGSTKNTISYYYGDLKGDISHLFLTNLDDTYDLIYFNESYTKVINGKLMVTTAKVMTGNIDGFHNQTTPPDMKIYYNTQNPDYKNQTNGQEMSATINKVVVYDHVPIFKS